MKILKPLLIGLTVFAVIISAMFLASPSSEKPMKVRSIEESSTITVNRSSLMNPADVTSANIIDVAEQIALSSKAFVCSEPELCRQSLFDVNVKLNLNALEALRDVDREALEKIIIENPDITRYSVLEMTYLRSK